MLPTTRFCRAERHPPSGSAAASQTRRSVRGPRPAHLDIRRLIPAHNFGAANITLADRVFLLLNPDGDVRTQLRELTWVTRCQRDREIMAHFRSEADAEAIHMVFMNDAWRKPGDGSENRHSVTLCADDLTSRVMYTSMSHHVKCRTFPPRPTSGRQPHRG